MSFISISILDLYQHGMQDHHETKSRWTYFYSWIVSTWDARLPWDQNMMSIIFGLDLYPHGDAISPWDQIKMDIFLFLNCINMGCKIAMRPKQDEHNFLVLTCINMEMQDHHETKTRRILVASCALSLHHYRIEEWYMTTRHLMHYLDLYQHGIKISMRQNQALLG